MDGGTLRNLGIEEAEVEGKPFTGILTGQIANATAVVSCYSTGSVRVNTSLEARLGGLVGYIVGSDNSLTGCYATSSIQARGHIMGGLVGESGSATLTNCYATGNVDGRNDVGGLVGIASGTITNCYATGNVTSSGDDDAGGLVGEASGAITDCYATGNVASTGDDVGGLVGEASGAIMGCHATGNVSNVTGDGGGLVGATTAALTSSYATGNVTGGSGRADAAPLGGLAGRTTGDVTGCYATGDVDGKGYVGGLVGTLNGSASATSCYVAGNVNGQGGTGLGGLVGGTEGAITSCYITGDVTGNATSTGSLVGEAFSSITSCYFAGNYSATGSSNEGAFVGNQLGGSVSNCYFDNDVSSRFSTDGGAMTTAELKEPTGYTGIYSAWGTNDPWDFVSDSWYPRLKYDMDGDGTPTAEEFGPQMLVFADDLGSEIVPELRVRGDLTGGAFVGTLLPTYLGTPAMSRVESSYFESVGNDVIAQSGASFDYLTENIYTFSAILSINELSVRRRVRVRLSYPDNRDADGDNLIEIRNLNELDAIRYDLNGDGTPTGTDDDQSAYRTIFGLVAGDNLECARRCRGYELAGSLDFEEAGSYASTRNDAWVNPANGGTADTPGWPPIGDADNEFSAVFEGNGYTLSNIYINRSSTDNIGLFGVIDGGNVYNFGLVGGSITGQNQVGALAGQANDATLRLCHASTTVNANRLAGGLVGVAGGAGVGGEQVHFVACYATESVITIADVAGGLVGSVGLGGSGPGGELSFCYATGHVERRKYYRWFSRRYFGYLYY